MSKKPVLLCIMDGFGWTPNETYGNAVAAAKKPFLDSLMAKYPMTTIDASGMAVGLPDGQMPLPGQLQRFLRRRIFQSACAMPAILLSTIPVIRDG